ncbi:hypothetical protein ACFWMT_22950 [Streptomyces sp. NPDC058368]|uniref:hypothetical protein n=1 Tax=Streptomyces sp. NPDC058368 TaxID=3346461 RepID=UPI00364F10B5
MRRAARDEGSYTLESLFCLMVLFAFFGLLAAWGLAGVFDSSVDNAAAAAARAASQADDAESAAARGEAAATAALVKEHRNCSARHVTIDTTQFSRPPGEPASVTATVTCTVPLEQLAVPGLPGSKTLTASATSALDQYADRTE